MAQAPGARAAASGRQGVGRGRSITSSERQLSARVVRAVEAFLVEQPLPVGNFQDRPVAELSAVIAENTAGRATDPDEGPEHSELQSGLVSVLEMSNVLLKRLSAPGIALKSWSPTHALPSTPDPNAKHF